jgi:hypothetical protein
MNTSSNIMNQNKEAMNINQMSYRFRANHSGQILSEVVKILLFLCPGACGLYYKNILTIVSDNRQ